MDLVELQHHSQRLGRVVFLATVSPDGRPHSAPVGIAWIEDRIAAFLQTPSVKVRNLRHEGWAHLHWQVSDETGNDSLLVEGPVTIVDTPDGRRALWHRMGYDLDQFEPGGPESDGHVFMLLHPQRGALLRRFGFDGASRYLAADAEPVIDLRELPSVDSPSGQAERRSGS